MREGEEVHKHLFSFTECFCSRTAQENQMFKYMESRFAGVCKACNCRFDKGTLIAWDRAYGARHASSDDCAKAKAAQAPLSVPDVTPRLDVEPIVDFLNGAAARGLKRPRLRVLAVDEVSEMVFSITTMGSAPGSLSIRIKGTWIGSVKPDGLVVGYELVTDKVLQQYLLSIASNPLAAAQKFAALTCKCAFCNKNLEDDGSVEVGYGPVCAKHWGLPHHPKGVRSLA